MKLIVGLGNPGEEYERTPHNLGFMAVDCLAEAHQARFSRREAQARVARATIEGKPVLLAKPQTFMNLSGISVAGLLKKWELSAADLVVLVDDVDIPLGSLRIRLRGSAGGHNGLKSIIGSVGTNQFVRIRMGAGPDRPVQDLVSYVLARFRKKDMETVAEMAGQAAEAARIILKEGPEKAMNRFNRKASLQES